MEIPCGTPARWGYVKLKSSESSWPIITAAARLEMASTNSTAVITIGGAAGVPVTVTIPWSGGHHRVRPDDRQLIDDQLGTIETWWEDALSDSRYRRRVAATVATRAIEAALAEDGN